MSIRFDASTDKLLRTTDLPNATSFSFTCKIYIPTAAGGNHKNILWWGDSGAFNVRFAVSSLGSGRRLQLESNGSAVDGTVLSSDVWYDIACIKNGATVELWLDGVLDASLATATNTAASYMSVGGNPYTEYLDGRMAAGKIWTAVALVQAEIQQERHSILPKRLTDIYGWWPMFPGATERLADYSGNGRNWTAEGTLTDEDPPPVGWGAGLFFQSPPVVASGWGQLLSDRRNRLVFA